MTLQCPPKFLVVAKQSSSYCGQYARNGNPLIFLEALTISPIRGHGSAFFLMMNMFPPSGLPSPNEFLVITDQLASPADFLLHRFLASHLKQSKNAKCLILSLSESLTRWKVLAGKAVSRICTLKVVSHTLMLDKVECQLEPMYGLEHCRVFG